MNFLKLRSQREEIDMMLNNMNQRRMHLSRKISGCLHSIVTALATSRANGFEHLPRSSSL